VLCSDPYEHALQHAGHGDLELTMVPAEQAVEQADVVLILVGHERFRALQIAPEKIVLDTVGFLRSRGA
jgi:UDP-N-acetyl-D-mannosaminuronate dehydrogenase